VNQSNYTNLAENQTVRVQAIDTVLSDGVAGSAALSGIAGVGATLDITIIRNTVTAFIGQNSSVHAEKNSSASSPAGNIEVNAHRFHKGIGELRNCRSGGGNVGIGGAVAILYWVPMLDSDSPESIERSCFL
jgi:hypothetical protein